MQKVLFLSGHAHLALDRSAEGASGGAELQVALLAQELVKRGHEVVLLASDTKQGDSLFLEGVKIRNGGRFDTGQIGDTLFALYRIIFILWKEKPDVVALYGWTSLLYLIAKLRWLMPYRLLFVCALDSEIDGGFRKAHPLRGWLFEKGMKLCDVRLGITEHQAMLFREQGMKCNVMRLLLQKLPSQSSAAPEKKIDLLWIARCHPVKQPLLFLELAARLPEARCQMISFMQDEKLWNKVQERVRALPNVELIETVPYREIQSYFDRANIFVNTSLDEGVPNTFVQAGLGHVAIASLNVDPDGMFNHFHAGFCAHGNNDKLIAGIEKLLKEKDLLSSAQHEAARFVEEWHNNGKNVEIFLRAIM